MPWNGIILTASLPKRCPACAKVGPSVEELGGLHRVSCVCGWSAKYEICAPDDLPLGASR